MSDSTIGPDAGVGPARWQGAIETDMEWVKRTIDNMDRKIDGLVAQESNRRAKVAAIAATVSTAVTALFAMVKMYFESGGGGYGSGH